MADNVFCAKCHKNFSNDFIVRYALDDEIVYTEHDYICTHCGYVNSVYEGEEKIQDWYFTFGFGQPHEGYYHVIRGGKEHTRREMKNRFGDKWGFQYNSAESAGVERYGLKKLS